MKNKIIVLLLCIVLAVPAMAGVLSSGDPYTNGDVNGGKQVHSFWEWVTKILL